MLPGAGRLRAHSLELIIPVLSRISFLTVTDSQNDVHHLSRGNEVQNLVSICRSTNQLAHKFLHSRAEVGLFVPGIHAMGMQFDKQPVGSAFYRNSRAFPKAQAMEAGRIRP